MMGDNSIPASLNGVPMNDEEFERHLQEIIGDAPDLNASSNTVQSGSSQRALSQSAEHSQGQFSRSPSLPPTASREPTVHSRSLPFSGDFVPKPTMTQTAHNKLGQVKAWGLNTYKCTKQLLSEKLGKVSRTVDLELEAQIEVLRDTKQKYEHILCLSKTLSNHFSQVVITQRALGEAFSELAQRSAELQDEFTYNCETQKALVRNGETLLGAMNFFISSVNTLITKTMEDTLVTVKSYETARLQYDAYRADLEQVNVEPKDSSHEAKIAEAKKTFEEQKERYDQLRADLAIKLKFLDENRIKVMHKQLLLFHNAVSAYFSGNQSALEATLKQFNIKLKTPNLGSPSWLEHQ